MKHAALILLTLSLVLFCVLPAGAEAAEPDETVLRKPLLSPGLNVLAQKKTMIRSGVGDAEICFSQADFEKALGYAPAQITVLSLPDPHAGVLKLGALDIQAGQTLSAQTLSSLRFLPASDMPCETSFTFSASGGAYETDAARTCRLCMTEVKNDPPLALDASVAAYCAIPVSGTLRAVDPEGDPLTFTLVRAPRKGNVSLDCETGAFVYTPADGKKGTDVFTYTVSDRYGNESALCRAEVEIRKPSVSVSYADLDGHWAATAAVAAAEAGIMVGENVGGTMLFSPDKPVTRAEFLVSAMRAAGYTENNIPACTKTVFADDDAIPSYRKGYVQAACDAGIISGTAADADVPVFSPDRIITRAEAAVMLERILGLDGTENGTQAVFSAFSAEDEESVPVWSRGAADALTDAGILSGTGAGLLLNAPLDRAQTAQLLAQTMRYLETRNPAGS